MPRDGSWPLLLWLLLCLFLAVAVSGRCYGQEPTSSPSATSIESKVNSLRDNLQKLGNTVKELKQELNKAYEKQADLETHLTTSQQESRKLTLLLTQSQETSTLLSQKYESYRKEAQRQIRNRTLGFIAAILLATAEAVGLVLLALK